MSMKDLCKHLEPLKEHLIIISTVPSSEMLDRWFCKTCGLKKVFYPQDCGIEIRDSL